VIEKNLLTKNYINSNYLDKALSKKLSKNFSKIIKDDVGLLDNSKNALNVLSDKFKLNFKTKDLKKFKKFKTLVIIGMGGSILGAEAVNSFLSEKINKKIYFFDDINTKNILNLKKKKNFKKILFLVISKSGNTVETISNFLALNIAKKNSKNIILISEKKNNFLFSLAKRFNLFYIEHKNYIGGRYSVLSEVGIVPAYLMGVNIFKLRQNLKKYLKKKDLLFLKDSSVKLANILNKKKCTNLIFLNYIPELEKFLYWCQQLIAESLGKNGKGFLPVISNVPKDHHSLLQLYLDGPKDKIFHIFSLEKKSKERINTNTISKNINFLNKKSLSGIKTAQKNALIKTFQSKNIPFREFKIKSLNEETLGELFAYFILETIIVGKLIKINPYNQPAVEQVKIITKELLS